MKLLELLRHRLLLPIALFMAISTTAAEEFVIVIDAGHGGKDPGAQSANKKVNEKDIALSVALRTGELIQKQHPEVIVKYTRRTDIYVTLNERAQVANKAKADLFLSIHCNAAESREAYGAEVFVLGSEEHRTSANLNAAKRENSVILLEKDYKKTYQGFDPSSPESYIIFEYLQGEFLKESIEFAQYVQGGLCSNASRYNRGVHQAGFLVLHATTMPSILVELGFISNADEEKFLDSSNGKEKLSKSIANGFDRYYLSIKKTENQPEDIHKQPQKEENENDNDIVQSNNATNDKSAIPNESTSTNTIIKSNTTIFKVQFLSTQSQLPSNSPKLKDMSKVDYYKEGNTYKYTCGATTDLKEIQAIKAKVSQTYKDAFIVAFQNGVKVNTTDAINEYKASH